MTAKTASPKPDPTQSCLLAGTLVFIRAGGYGFIRLDLPSGTSATEYFVHVKDFPSRSHWKVGQPVFFEAATARTPGKAPQALNVTLR